MIVIHKTEDENMTRKSKPAKELNMHMDNKDVITGTPSMIQPMNNDNIKREIMRTEVICHRNLTAKSTPFIWNDDNHMWYNITKFKAVLHGKHSGGEFYFDNKLVGLADKKYFGRISVSSKTITRLEQNFRETFRRFGKFLKSKDFNQLGLRKYLEGPSKRDGYVATFNNVVVSYDGWIVHRRHCYAVINGGCKNVNSWSPPSNPIMKYDRVISIAMMYGEQIWHFLMESFVGLAYVTTSDKRECYIHVTSKTKWAKSWLGMIGIPSDRIIEGTIAANTLIVPQMGRCGAPSRGHLNWLRTIIPSRIPPNPNSIILIKRTHKRVMQNFDAIQKIVENFANELKLEFVLHDDSSLPSIPGQLQRFANASIVIGPHGAGMVNIVASKRRTCLIEFALINPLTCFMRLSFVLGQNYVDVPLYEENTMVELIEVKKALHKCLQL